MLESINPTVKFVCIVAAGILLSITHATWVNVAVAVGCLFWLLLGSRASRMRVLGFVLPALWVAFGMFMTGYLFSQGGDGDPSHGVLAGTFLVTRVLMFAGLGALFSLTTDPLDLVRSFQQQGKLPPVFAYGVLSALHVVPRMREQYQECRRAMVMRGMRVHPFSPVPIRNMLVNTVRWSDILATAMESRGFDGNMPRTIRHVVPLRPVDGVFGAVWIAITFGLLIAERIVG